MEKREFADGGKTVTGKLKRKLTNFITLLEDKRRWSYIKLEKLPQIYFQKVQEN